MRTSIIIILFIKYKIIIVGMSKSLKEDFIKLENKLFTQMRSRHESILHDIVNDTLDLDEWMNHTKYAIKMLNKQNIKSPAIRDKKKQIYEKFLPLMIIYSNYLALVDTDDSESISDKSSPVSGIRGSNKVDSCPVW